MWNPYLNLSQTSKRIATFSSLIFVLIVWSLLSGLNIIESNKLPSPWDVGKAFSTLTWSEAQVEKT